MAKNIKGITIELSGDTSKLNDSLKALQSESKKVQTELKGIEYGLRLDPKNIELLTQKKKLLSDQVENASKKVELLEQAFKEASDQFARGEISEEQFRKVSRELEIAKGETNKFAGELEKTEGALQDAAEGLDDVAGGAKDVGEEVEKTSGKELAIMGLNATIEIFGKLKDSVIEAFNTIQEAWAEVDEAQDTIIAKTGASGDALEEMNGVFSKVYGSMPVEAQAVGDAIGELNTQFGLNGDALEDATEQLLMFAELNGSDVTGAVQSAKGAMDQFGKSGEDLSQVLDVVNKTGQDTGVSIETLLDKVAGNAPILQELGLGFEESVVLMGQFEQSGLDSSKMLAGMTKSATVFAKENKSVSEGLLEFSEYANSSASQTDKLNEASRIFGTKNGIAMLKIAQDGKLNFEDLASAVSEAGGNVASTFEAVLDPADQFVVAQNNMKLAMAELSNALQGAFAPVLEVVVGLIQDAVTWFTGLSDETKTIIGVVGALSGGLIIVVGALASLGAAMAFLPALQASVSAGFGLISTAMSGLGATLMANPIAIGIGLAIAAIVLLIKNWDTVKEKATELWNKITEVFTAIGTAISDAWTSVKDATTDAWNNVKDSVTNAFNNAKESVTNTADNIKNGLSNTWGSIKTSTSDAFNAVKGFMTDRITQARDSVSSTLDNMKRKFDENGGGIQGAVSAAMEGARGFYKGAFDKINSITGGRLGDALTTVRSKFDAIKNAITDKIEAAKEGVRNAIERIKGFFNFSWSLPKIKLPHFSISGKFSLNPPQIPRLSVQWYDKGGIFTAPSIIGVGEKRPEFVGALDDLRYLIGDELDKRGGSQGDINIVIQNVENNRNQDIEDLAREIAWLVKREVKLDS